MLKASDLRATHGDAHDLRLAQPDPVRHARTGLVGPNGAGKTTLLRLLAGVNAPERGSVKLGAGDRVGYLPQEPPGPDLTIDRLLGAALGEVWRLHGELERLEGRLDEPEMLARYGEAQERFGALDGWALQAQLDSARDALGIAHIPLDAPLGELSGGEAARALLAGVLLARPTVPAARRADQPPRPRRPRVAGGVPRRLRRRGAGGVARSPLPRRRRSRRSSSSTAAR